MDTELPPRPDPETGEPFPPHGLAFSGSSSGTSGRYRETRLSRKPKPPKGMGPTLAWWRENRRGRIVNVIGAFTLMAGGSAVISLLNGIGLEGLAYWQLWVVILVFTYLMSDPFKDWAYSAGADWVQREYTRWGYTKKRYVKTYELRRVDCSYAGATFQLTMSDAERTLSCAFTELQSDRRIWDLVYNGILHSVANGAKATAGARSILQLDRTAATYLARKNTKLPNKPHQDPDEFADQLPEEIRDEKDGPLYY